MLFWYVTCDLSVLIRPQRYLMNKFNSEGELIQQLLLTFDGLETLHRQHSFDIGILTSPPVFIKTWNQQHGDPEWEKRRDSCAQAGGCCE